MPVTPFTPSAGQPTRHKTAGMHHPCLVSKGWSQQTSSDQRKAACWVPISRSGNNHSGPLGPSINSQISLSLILPVFPHQFQLSSLLLPLAPPSPKVHSDLLHSDSKPGILEKQFQLADEVEHSFTVFQTQSAAVTKFGQQSLSIRHVKERRNRANSHNH